MVNKFPDVRKLVVMLGSPVDGECVAAARALDRTLKRSGFDWHGLADVIENGSNSSTKKTNGLVNTSDDLVMYNHCWKYFDGLRPREQDFIQSVGRQFGFGRDLSAKQRKWLRAIFVATGGGH